MRKIILLALFFTGCSSQPMTVDECFARASLNPYALPPVECRYLVQPATCPWPPVTPGVCVPSRR